MLRRNKIIILIVILAAVFVFVLLALAPAFMKKKIDNQNAQDLFFNTNTSRDSLSQGTGAQEPDSRVQVFTKEPGNQSALIAVAMTFTERFGSFSTQGNFENLKDSQYYMTEKLKAWSESYMEKNKNREESQEFYGVTTRALKADILTLDDDEKNAQVLVSVQQEENHGSQTGRGAILYKRLLLDCIKMDGSWKVDTALWQ